MPVTIRPQAGRSKLRTLCIAYSMLRSLRSLSAVLLDGVMLMMAFGVVHVVPCIIATHQHPHCLETISAKTRINQRARVHVLVFREHGRFRDALEGISSNHTFPVRFLHATRPGTAAGGRR